MSLIRLSALHNTLFAPEADGTLTMEHYSKRSLTGQMEAIDEPSLAGKNSDLWHYLARQVKETTSKLDDNAPVVIMVHGFLFDPKQSISPLPKDTDNPHGRMYHFIADDEVEEIRHHTSSWPLGLGFMPDDVEGRDGLAIAFGWLSQPGFASSLIHHFKNFYSRAYENAGEAAWLLANIIHVLQQQLPGKQIELFCHSLGSRVVVRALALLAKHAPQHLHLVDRVILLGGAEYVVEAQLMMRRMMALPTAVRPSFYNIVSRENDVLDKLGENFGPRTFGSSQVIGHNGIDSSVCCEEWMDIQIDNADVMAWMQAQHGLTISGDRPGNVWDHWYYYTFRGNMELYNAILRDKTRWHIPTLRTNGIPEGVARRWSLLGD